MSKSEKHVSFKKFCSILEPVYGLERHHNLKNAFWELVFIIISLRTAERVYLGVFRELRKRFPTARKLATARLRSLESILRPAGLAKLKSPQIRNAARVISRDFGERGLTSWGRANPAELEDYLCTLPGVAKKVAKCISMYSCNAESLPVDAHVWRVLSRLGHAPGGRLTERAAIRLEAAVPPDARYAVHVLCVSHGRALCGRVPQCGACPLRNGCPTGRRVLKRDAVPRRRPATVERSYRSAGKPTS